MLTRSGNRQQPCLFRSCKKVLFQLLNTLLVVCFLLVFFAKLRKLYSPCSFLNFFLWGGGSWMNVGFFSSAFSASINMKAKVLFAQSCPTVCNPMDSSVHGILANILEWVAILFSMGSSQPRDWIWVSCTEGRFFLLFGPPGKPNSMQLIWLLFFFSLLI